MGDRLAGRIALVTGASRGIGQAVARRFAAEGATLVLTARTVGGLEETDDLVRAAGGTSVLVPFDIADGDKIDELGLRLHERFGRLDVLVGNAAVLGGLGPLAHVEPKAWAAALAVNLTANWRLIRSLDPLLRASPAGRAVFVTSGVTRGIYAYWGLYAATKTALETLVLTYAAETAKTNVRVNLVDPGVVRTRLRAEAMPGEDPMSLPPPDSVCDLFVRLAEASCREHGQRLRAQ
jgi:NAD(P)-dependent dehydrogenase (short-subunit alcohol dehydrogenase family)